jgi:hypothetical protein
VVGDTFSNDFPGAINPRTGTDRDAFVIKLDSSFNLLNFTYFGGSDSDSAYAFTISGSDIYVVGSTNSNDFLGGTVRDPSRTDQDVFVIKLDSSFNTLVELYLGGGNRDDIAYLLAISGSDIYVAGDTFSNDFPGATPRDSSRTDRDVFVAKLSGVLTGGDGGGGSGGSGSGSGSGSGTGSGSGSSGGSGSGTGSGGGSGAVGGTGGGGGGGCSMTGSASSMAGLWNILVWLSVPAFVLARRIRRR